MFIALTGCNGDIGRRITLLALEQGHTVRGIDAQAYKAGDFPNHISSHERLSHLIADLRDFNATLEALRGCDAIIQLAALRTPGDYLVEVHNSNVVISWNVLRAAAELGITRVSTASSVNAIGLIWNKERHFDYLPLDEAHPCRPDEPYGLSKQILELQADAIARRYPEMRIATLRPSWVVPSHAIGMSKDRPTDLWGWVQEDATADAFLRGLTAPEGAWTGHECFFIAAPTLASNESFEVLHKHTYPNVPLKPGKWTSFFDCNKAERLLGWVHPE